MFFKFILFFILFNIQSEPLCIFNVEKNNNELPDSNVNYDVKKAVENFDNYLNKIQTVRFHNQNISIDSRADISFLLDFNLLKKSDFYLTKNYINDACVFFANPRYNMLSICFLFIVCILEKDFVIFAEDNLFEQLSFEKIIEDLFSKLELNVNFDDLIEKNKKSEAVLMKDIDFNGIKFIDENLSKLEIEQILGENFLYISAFQFYDFIVYLQAMQLNKMQAEKELYFLKIGIKAYLFLKTINMERSCFYKLQDAFAKLEPIYKHEIFDDNFKNDDSENSHSDSDSEDDY